MNKSNAANELDPVMPERRIGQFKRMFSVSLQIVIELLIVFPLLFGIAIYFIDQETQAWLMIIGLWGYSVWGAVLKQLLSMKKRIYWFLMGWLTTMVWAYVLHGITWIALGSFILGIIIFVRSLGLSDDEWHARFSSVPLWFGLAAYAPASFFYSRIESLMPYQTELTIAGILLFAASVLSSNRMSIFQAALTGNVTPSKRVAVTNRILILLFGAGIFMVAISNLLLNAIYAIGEWVVAGIRALFALFPNNPPDDEIREEPVAGSPDMPMVPSGEPAAFWKWLEMIMMILIWSVITVGVVYLLYLLARHAVKWIRRFMLWITSDRLRGADITTGGYIDEITTTREQFGLRKIKEGLVRFAQLRRSRLTKWEDMQTNADKIRFLYGFALRKAIREGYDWKYHLTPEELSNDAAKQSAGKWLNRELSQQYEASRYGGQEPNDNQILKWREWMKRGKKDL